MRGDEGLTHQLGALEIALHLRTSARPPGLATTVHLRTGHNSTRQARGEEIGAEIGELRGGDAQGREWLVR